VRGGTAEGTGLVADVAELVLDPKPQSDPVTGPGVSHRTAASRNDAAASVASCVAGAVRTIGKHLDRLFMLVSASLSLIG
jgi:hypothetical protein